MRLVPRATLTALLIVGTVSLAACGGEEAAEPEVAADAEVEEPMADRSPAATAEGCPPAEEVAAIVGHLVESRDGGTVCFYETADFESAATIMRISSGQVEQLEREMRESAEPSGAELETVDVGDRARVWGSPGYGQAYAISGDRGWLVDVSSQAMDGDLKAETVRLLERMIEE